MSKRNSTAVNTQTTDEDMSGDSDSEDDEATDPGTFKRASDSELASRKLIQGRRKLSTVESNNRSSDTFHSINAEDLEAYFSSKMIILNEMFLKSCQQNVESDPDCCLAPVMKDYLLHCRTLLCKVDRRCSESKDFDNHTCNSNNKNSNYSFEDVGVFFQDIEKSLNITAKQSVDRSVTSKPPNFSKNVFESFSFAVDNNASTSANWNNATSVTSISRTCLPSLNVNSTDAVGSNSIFAFNDVATEAESQNVVSDNRADEDELDSPSDFKPVVESDAVYAIKCKVFVMKEVGYQEKGVGRLYVKKLHNGKHQLVVRADNNLGTILLNLIVQTHTKLKQLSKKDIMIVDCGTQNISKFLIRTKTESESQELFKKIEEFKIHS